MSTLLITGCSDEDEETIIYAGDYPVKEYYLERSPSVNVWGCGMDFIHDECTEEDTDLDYQYLTSDSTEDNEFDINFYTVKAYYTDDNGDIQTEGCPAMLLNDDIEAYKIGEGVDFFDSCTVITEDMLSGLTTDPFVDYESCYDESVGYYIQDLLYEQVDSCVIGRSFRSSVLVIPDGYEEEEVQPVYLVKSLEGGYTKFMVKQFQGDEPNQKQTLVRWQVISE